MDTKWKKWKIILSMAAFFLGMSLLITNAVSAWDMLSSWGTDLFQGSGDYQESREFRQYVSNRLEELLSAAVGGNSWKNYGAVYSDGVWEGTAQGDSSITKELEEAVAESSSRITQEEQEINEATGYPENSYAYGTQEYPSSWTNLREYMVEKAKDKNLQYALVYQKKLLYTNIEAWEGKTLIEWDGTDFYESLDQEEYNFCLWFNKNGDGKVEISRNGWQEDVYGDGIYDSDSLWYVPGYSNFNVDASTEDAVVFFAVAKNPRLYITGNYSDYGTAQYGGDLYYWQQQYFSQRKQFRSCCIWLAVAAVLLLLSFLMRKYRRLGNQVIARFLGKLWMEFKVPFCLLFPPIFLFFSNQDAVREIWMILNLGGYWRDAFYQMEQMVMGEAFILACFWLIYLIVLDLKSNWGHLRKPLIDRLRTKELSYPVQKRLIRRYGLMLATGILSLLAVIVSVSFAFRVREGYYQGYSGYNSIEKVWQDGLFLVVILLSLLLLACVITGFATMKKYRRLAEDIGVLSDQIKAVKGGNLNTALKLPEDTDLRQAAEDLNDIQHGLENALKEQMHSERMKVELVANVSHDIKTPLTSIISYVDLLKQEEGLPEHVQEFIQILWEKSERLKTMVQDVFEVSKAASGQLPVQLEELDLGKLLRQTLADMDSQIADSGLKIRTAIPEEPVLILADGQRLYRVFQNLLQNALKYSLAGSRVFLSLTKTEMMHVVCIKNTSTMELEQGKDFTERFVRGDESRTDGGSGLGLSIAKSFTEACHGSFQVSMDADLFTVTVSFPEI